MSQTIDLKVEYTNKLAQENEAIKAQVERLKKIAKEEAHDAYYEASDNNRCDRWSDTFDEDIRAEFEEYWNKNKIYEKFKIEPDQCLLEIKAQAVEEILSHFGNKFRANEKLTVRDICWMLNEHLNQLRQQAKELNDE